MFYSKQISLKLFIILWTYPALIYSIGDISGIVLNQEGKPVNAIVIIYDYKTANKLVKIDQIFTNSRGEFEYKNLKNGSYKISVINSNYDIYNKMITINGKIFTNDNKTLIIKLNSKLLTNKRNNTRKPIIRFFNFTSIPIYFIAILFLSIMGWVPVKSTHKNCGGSIGWLDWFCINCSKIIEPNDAFIPFRIRQFFSFSSLSGPLAIFMGGLISILSDDGLINYNFISILYLVFTTIFYFRASKERKRLERLKKEKEKERKRLERAKQKEKERRDKWSNELGEEWKKSKYAKLKVPELKEELSIRSWVVIYKPYNKKEYVIVLLDDDANNPESTKLRTKVIKQREMEEKRKKEARSKAAKKATATRKANKKQRERDAKKAAATRKANQRKREKEELKLLDNSVCQGSGFLISNQGLVVTAYHVIENSKLFFIRFPLLELEFIGKVFIKDRNNDVAILKIPKTELVKVYKDDIPLRHFKSVNARVGENVITFGYPFGEILGSSPKLNDGRISDTSGMNDNPTHYQITNAIQPGNSGGPLINKSGNLIGIVVGSMSDQFAVQISGAIPQNVNFAVKVEYLSQALQSKNIKVPEFRPAQASEDNLPTEVLAERVMPIIAQIRVPKEDL